MEKKVEYQAKNEYEPFYMRARKNVSILKETHLRLSQYCQENGFMVQFKADKIIKDFLENAKVTQQQQ